MDLDLPLFRPTLHSVQTPRWARTLKTIAEDHCRLKSIAL